MSPEEIIRAAFQARRERLMGQSLRDWRANVPQLILAFRSLTAEQGQRIAEDVWRDFDPKEDGYLLAQLGASVPGALATIQDDMVERRVFYPSFLYLGASDNVAKRLTELVSAPVIEESYNHLLLCLAWIGSERVVRQFQAWRGNPPAWQSELYLPPWDYSLDAGWELTAQGTRRDLYFSTAYEMIPRDDEQATSSGSELTLHEPHEGRCGWCGRQLVTLLRLDLRDQRLAIATQDGSLLRIAICPWCSTYTTLITNVDLEGASSWSDANEERPAILDKISDDGSEIEMEELIQRPIALGALRRTPYEAVGRFMLDEPGISQIGGHPDWIQDMEYPICPTCQQHMICIAQISWEDFEEYAEGSTYAFVCLEDGKAATVYQQT
jgi:hypothetical protein